MKLRIDQIRTDGGTQPRAALDQSVISEYAEAMQNGADFPPVGVVYDNTSYWVWDGFHRLKSAIAARFSEIECDVRPGTLSDAQWLSYGANLAHGKQREKGDKQRAIEAALQHPKAERMSSYEIAAHVGVSQTWVVRIRERVSKYSTQIPASTEAAPSEFPNMPAPVAEEKPQPKEPETVEDQQMRTVTRNGKQYSMNTAGIGRGAAVGAHRKLRSRATLERVGRMLGASEANAALLLEIDWTIVRDFSDVDALKDYAATLSRLARTFGSIAKTVKERLNEAKTGEYLYTEDCSEGAFDPSVCSEKSGPGPDCTPRA